MLDAMIIYKNKIRNFPYLALLSLLQLLGQISILHFSVNIQSEIKQYKVTN